MMRKSTSRVAPKRAVQVYKDAENLMCKKVKTDNGGNSKFVINENVPRKPLAHLQHRNLTAVNDATNIKKRCFEGVLREAKSEPQTTKPTYEKRSEYTTQPGTTVEKREAEQTLKTKEGVLPEAVTKNLQAREKIRKQNEIVFSVPCYLKNIYKYLFAQEDRFQIPKDHLEGQAFTGGMRAVLIDWLAGLIDHMDLLQETLQLTVYVIDKYMSINKKTTKASAQLVGLSALFVAAKYEETEVIELTDLTIVCGHAWFENDIKSMEREILETIGYKLGKPLAIHFIRRLSRISGASPMEHCYAKFFADTSLLSYHLCHVKPSKIAAASVFLGLCVSRNRIDVNFWTPELIESSGYNLDDLQPILNTMAKAVTGAEAGKLRGIQSRYSCSQLYCVSIMPGCKAGGIICSF